MAAVSPSEFRQVFRFERFTKQPNNSLGNGEVFDNICNTRGKWEYQSGDRAFVEGTDLEVQIYRATCYWRSALENILDKDTRLIYENAIYKILSVERIGEQRRFYQFRVAEAH